MDLVLRTFLTNTALEAAALEARSEVLTLTPLPPAPPCAYCCAFRVPYLRRTTGGTVERAPGPVLCLIRFPVDYLCSADERLFLRVASVANAGFIHPNVAGGMVCLGTAFEPGTPLAAVVWQLFEIVTYRNCTLDERNAMDPEACRLLRQHPALIEPLTRPRLFRSRRTSTEPGPDAGSPGETTGAVLPSDPLRASVFEWTVQAGQGRTTVGATVMTVVREDGAAVVRARVACFERLAAASRAALTHYLETFTEAWPAIAARLTDDAACLEISIPIDRFSAATLDCAARALASGGRAARAATAVLLKEDAARHYVHFHLKGEDAHVHTHD